jgi:very-short-patch-repair endonuclease
MIINCFICGKERKINPHEMKKGKPMFCSQICWGRWQKTNRQGENHPVWKGGKTKRNCKICGKEIFTYETKGELDWGKFCSLSCATVYKNKHQKQKKTGIEIKVEKYLTELGIKFEEQKVIPEGKTVADFYIPEQHLVIYADGLYWHKSRDAKERDQRQEFLLGFNGYKILRLPEKEINDGKFERKINKCLRSPAN